MTSARIRSFLVPFLATSAMMGIGWGSIFFAMGHDSSVLDWIITVTGSSVYSAIIGLPTAFGLFLLLPRLRRIRPVLQLLAAAAAVVPLGAAGAEAANVIQTAVFHAPGGFVAQLPQTLGIVFIFFLVTGLIDTQTRLRQEELARERSLRLAADAHLSSLESRIRPHFLFNALNSVLALIHVDPQRAEAVLERITALLRASLQQSSGSVPLGDELTLVTDYLEIERVRFEERLRYVIDVPRELEAVDVPAFSVQTLVENAVKHAVAVRREGAEIRVVASTDGESVNVVVSDDGPGFDGATLPSGHGLDTLRGRLAALFGEVARLEIGKTSAGARVAIHVPARREAA